MSDVSPAQFERLLFSGHGRALVYLQDFGTAGLEEIILRACLRNTAYDRQCEGGRSAYFADLFRIAQLDEFLRPRILNALKESSPHSDHGYDHAQLLELTALLARRGSREAHAALYDAFRSNLRAGSMAGDSDIVETDGAPGYLYVLEEIGKHGISRRGNEWKPRALHKWAAELIGADAAREVFRAASAAVPGVLRFAGTLEEVEVPSDYLPPHAPYVHIPYAEYRAALTDGSAADDRFDRQPFKRRGMPVPSIWSRNAPDEDLARAAVDMAGVIEPHVLTRYLQIFSSRRYPNDPKFLLSLLDSDNNQVVRAAYQAAALITHGAIRKIALERMDSPEWGPSALMLLASNFQPEDTLLLEAVVRKAGSRDSLHELAQSSLHVIESVEGEWKSLLRLIYDHTPCTLCRGRAVSAMTEDFLLTPELIRECLLDADEATRQCAAAGSGGW